MDPATMALINLITAPLGTAGTLAVIFLVVRGKISERFLQVVNDITSIKDDIQTIKTDEKECKRARENAEKELGSKIEKVGEKVAYIKGQTNGHGGR